VHGYTLEILNGNWALAAASLTVICAIYLVHEAIAYKVFGYGWRSRATGSMRVMLGVMTLALGVTIRSVEVTAWRMRGGDLPNLSQFWLILGGTIALIGFICTIREISKPLYGNGPWIWTLVAMAAYTAGWGLWRLV